jgi:hypothetical protein
VRSQEKRWVKEGSYEGDIVDVLPIYKNEIEFYTYWNHHKKGTKVKRRKRKEVNQFRL